MAGSSRVQDNTYLPYLSPTQMVSFLLYVTLNGELEVDMPAEEAKLDAEEMRKKEKCC